MANHTFGGVQFHIEQQDGTSTPLWPDEYVTVVEHVPGSDTDVVHHLGKRGAQEVTFPVVVPESDWASFVALRGQTLTLALIGDATRLATLTKVQNARWFASEGFYKAQATWLG